MSLFDNYLKNDNSPDPELQGNTPNNVDIKSAKKIFSKTGLALVAVLFICQVLIIVAVYAANAFGGENNWLTSSSTGIWLLNIIPMYLIAIPVGILLLKKLPSSLPEKTPLSKKGFWLSIPISIFLMNIGSQIGNTLSLLLSNGQAENAVVDYAMDQSVIKFFAFVLIAPLAEEFLFRKMIIDKTNIYGEKTAVLLSALVFGLFHTNMFQFFYAFLIGMFFGYIYIRTGKLHYTVILHSIINFFGSVVAPYITSKIDYEAVYRLLELDPAVDAAEIMEIYTSQLPGLLMLFGYSVFWGGLSLAGLAIVIIKRKCIVWKKSELLLPKDSVATTVYMNPGIMLFIILSVCLTIASLF